MSKPEAGHLIEIVGEGKTDRGRGTDRPEAPTEGIIPVLVHRLCDRPDSMRVRRRPLPFLQGKGLWQKVRFAKRNAFNSGSAGLVFVLDTEGNHPGQLEQLQRGRDSELLDYRAAVGVAHPCVEAWLLADASAIARALGLTRRVDVPAEPEALPAPCKDRDRNPKAILGRCAGRNRPLSSAETTGIVHAIRDLDSIRTRCPIGFAPFADEIVVIIKAIFDKSSGDESAS
jgi:hypothetical protein